MERKKNIKETIEDIVEFPRRLAEVMEGLEDEMDYLIKHNFFEEFEKLTKNMETMVNKVEDLTASIDKFTVSVEKITVSTEVITKLEQRLSLRGLIVHTVKDFFYMLYQIVEVAILRNVRKIDDLRRGRGGENR